MPATLAGPPGASCWTGIKHTGSPQGRVEPLGGLDTYIVEPPAGAASDPHKKVLLFLADAYGPLFIINKLLQDYFASRGMSVPIGMHAVRCHLYETESQDSSYSVQIIFSGFPYRICHPIVTRSHGLARHSPQQ